MDFKEAAAEALAAQGMQAAIDHADSGESSWSDVAAALFRMYGMMHPEGFMTEDVRAWSDKLGFDDPPDNRAWGAVARILQATKEIESCGVEKQKSLSCHRSYKTVWKLVKN